MLENGGIRMGCSFRRGDETSLPEELEQLSVEIPQGERVVVYELLVLGLGSGEGD